MFSLAMTIDQLFPPSTVQSAEKPFVLTLLPTHYDMDTSGNF